MNLNPKYLIKILIAAGFVEEGILKAFTTLKGSCII